MREVDPSVASLLEFVTKMATLLVVGSYAVGYSILVINNNAHGFLETSLIKPRAITTGAVFILATALPIAMTQGTFFGKGSDPESKLETFTRLLLGLVDYLCACSAAGFLMGFLVFTDDLHGASMTMSKAIAFLVFLGLVGVAGTVRFVAVRDYRKGAIAWIAFSIVCLGGIAVALYSLRGFAIMRCMAWMFGVATAVNPWLSDIRRGVHVQFKITALIAMLLVVVSLYTVHLFPFMKATWGGGAPVAAILYLSKDSPIHPDQKVKVALLEASDSGFYFIFDGEEKATYVPRDSVTAMEFPQSSSH